MKFFARSLQVVGVCCATVTFSLPQIVRAQPDEAAAKAANPAAEDVQKKALDKAMEEGRETIEKVAKMTPAQIRDYMQEIQEKTVRTLLVQSEFNDLELQDIVIEYLRQQNLARAQPRLIAANLRDAIADKNTPELKLRQLMAQWQKASEQEQLRSEDATLELREILKLDERPRLDAVLHLYGLIGNETWSVSNALGGMSGLALLPTPQEIKALPAQ